MYNNTIHGIYYYVFHESNTGKFGQKTTRSPYPTNNATENKNRKYLLQINEDNHAKKWKSLMMLNIEHDICHFIFKSAIVLIGCSSLGCNTIFHQPEHKGIFLA